ncbi:MAG: hypothetical protein ACK5VR_00210 [Burkholderiales bacterium]
MLLYRDGVFAIASPIRARLCSGAAQISFFKMTICSMAWLWVMLVRTVQARPNEERMPLHRHTFGVPYMLAG